MGAEESKCTPVEHLHEVERRLLVHAGVPIRIRDLLLPREQESIHYAYCEGRGEVGKGKPLVMVHGYGFDLGCFYRMLKFVVERWKGPIYLLDLPGMGASIRKEKKFKDPHEVERFFVKRLRFWVDTVLPYSAELIEKLSKSDSDSSGGGITSSKSGPGKTPPVLHEKFVLVAHSFGGYLCTALANSIKHRIAGLVLLSPFFGFPKSWQPKEDEQDFRQRVIEAIFDIGEANGGMGVVKNLKNFGSWGDYFFRQWVRHRFATPPPEHEFDALIDYQVAVNYDAAPGTESALMGVFGKYLITKADIPLFERVDLDGVPVISFYGDDDWVDRQGASYLGDIGVITGCTHQLYLEFPRLVCRCIIFQISEEPSSDEEKDSKNKASGAGASAQLFRPQARGTGAGKPSSTRNSKLSQEGKGPILSKTSVATINEGDEENEEKPDSAQSLDSTAGGGAEDKELGSAVMQVGSAKSRAIKKFHAEACASFGGRTPGVWIYPETEVTKSDLQMNNAAPSYSRRPYKKVLKIRNRQPNEQIAWIFPKEQGDGMDDTRKFRTDYDTNRSPAA
eukprot:g15289.t1